MQRLFSSFANGAPGAGLLLMRLAAFACLALQAAGALSSSASTIATVFGLLASSVALLLLVGLWTPVVGVLVAIAAGWHGMASPADLGVDMLLGILGLALALLGPGAWSVDARLFGWKRLDIQDAAAADDKPSRSRDDSSPF